MFAERKDRFLGKIGGIFETRRESGELSVQWKIRNFFSLSRKSEEEDYYESHDFHFSDACWVLKMYPYVGGGYNDPLSGWADVLLVRKDKGPPLTIKFTLDITGVKKEGKNTEQEHKFSEEDDSLGWSPFFSKKVWRDPMPNSMITISCRMKSVMPSPARGASIQMDGKFKEAQAFTEENNSLEKQGIEKVLEDFGKLLVSCENSDVTVQVGDTEFRAHRAILSVRCPVLSAMFQHQTAEKASNKIIVKECEPEVFRDFLQYLYTGSIQSLTQQNVFGLYRIADQYLADNLKLQCLKHIRDTLCVQTFCDAIKLALLHGDSSLLQQTIDFATKNISLILCTVEWQNFICENPSDANEILIKCFGPRS